MQIAEFDSLFFRVIDEINSVPTEVIMSRYPPGTISVEEALGLILQESKEYAEKLVYRVLAEILVDE